MALKASISTICGSGARSDHGNEERLHHVRLIASKRRASIAPSEPFDALDEDAMGKNVSSGDPARSPGTGSGRDLALPMWDRPRGLRQGSA